MTRLHAGRSGRSLLGRLALVLSVVAPVVAGGCASGGRVEEEGVRHTVTQADAAALKSTSPLEAGRVTLYINGMGCPLCVTNVDKELEDVPGVRNIQVDLGGGTVAFDVAGDKRPSPARIADAVADAGLTLVKLEAK